MAFDDVTFFEVNLPEHAFSRSAAGESERAETDDESSAEQSGESGSGGRSKGRLLLVALVLAGAAFGVRKLRSGGGGDDDVTMEYEEPGVEVEKSEP